MHRSQAPRVVCFGEALVEFLADQVGVGFGEVMGFRGPFPSGAPAIFADQVARLGLRAGLIAAVGDDDFGRLIRARLAGDGVDVSAITMERERTTGIAFVRYRPNGKRDFIFTIGESACTETRLIEAGRAQLQDCAALHIMGSSLFSSNLVELARTAISIVKETGAIISFDPNLRPELLTDGQLPPVFEEIIDASDIVLPGADELLALTDAVSEETAVKRLASRGVSTVVVKRGAAGATCYTGCEAYMATAKCVREVDPTGAGDCFAGTFLSCRVLGCRPEVALAYANAAGAHAVGKRGPMEGTTSFAKLDTILADSRG